MFSISICVIMKNEEKHMKEFLNAIQDHFRGYDYELVLVDTGSTDRTVDFAKEYTEKIFHFSWINDFSAARNFSLQCASRDWILVLDCDEYVENIDVSCFETMAKQYPDGVGLLSRKNHYEMNGTDSVYIDHVERFFNRQKFHYEEIIHEQVRTLSGRSDYARVDLPLTVDHCGYNGSEEEKKKKADRDNALLLQLLKERPDDPYLLFQIGQSYNMLHDDKNACYYYGKGLEQDVDPNAEYVQMMVIGYGYTLLHLERYEEALQFKNIYDEFATTPEFVVLMGLIYLRTGNLVNAMAEFLKATSFPTARTQGSNSFIPYYNMGCINEVLGETASAIALYKKCGNFPPALARLKELDTPMH